MDFTPLLRDAWRTAWHRRGWWLLGLLGGGVVGPVSLPSLRAPASQPGMSPATSAQLAALEAEWRRGLDSEQAAVLTGLRDHLALVAAWAAVSLVLIVVVWYWSIAAQGALSWATTRLACGQDAARGDARRAGRRLFGRYLRLWLIPFGLAVLALADEGWYIVQHLPERSLGGVLSALANLGESPLLLLPSLLWLPLGVWLTLAKRAIAMEDAGTGEALLLGWRLLRGNLGQALLAWVIGFAVWWGALIVAMIGLAIVAVIAGVGVALFVAFLSTRVALTAGFAPYAAVGVFVFAVAVLFVAGLVNVFMWSYWSHVYLRLRARGTFASVALG